MSLHLQLYSNNLGLSCCLVSLVQICSGANPSSPGNRRLIKILSLFTSCTQLRHKKCFIILVPGVLPRVVAVEKGQAEGGQAGVGALAAVSSVKFFLKSLI